MKYEFATSDQSKIEAGKQHLMARAREPIVGFVVREVDDDVRLTAGVRHWIVAGYTSQRELDAAQKAATNT